MHRVHFCSLLLSLAAACTAAPVSGQEKTLDIRDENYRRQDWGLLEKDARLAKPVSFELQNPSVKQMLRLLQQLTGVPLSADSQSLGQTLGGLEAEDMPAWEVMRQIVLTDGVKGGWKKSGDGYRLEVTIEPETEPTLPAPEPTKWWIFLLPLPAVFLIAAGLYVYRSGTRKPDLKDSKK